MRDLVNRMVYFGDQDHFLSIELTNGDRYCIYFKLWKDWQERSMLRLLMQSAYIRNKEENLAKVKFALLLRNVKEGKETRKPHHYKRTP